MQNRAFVAKAIDTEAFIYYLKYHYIKLMDNLKDGTVLHIAKNRALVMRLQEGAIPPDEWEKVYDSNSRFVGRVLETFGPVSHPYISIKPSEKINTEKLVGSELYLKR